jgi:ferredoxin
MKIRVDADHCTGHGRCYMAAPDLLTYDDEGYVTIRGSAIDVPDNQVVFAREAAANCPEQAITIED